MTRLRNPFNQRTTWQYDAVSQVTTQMMHNGTQARSTYDAAGNLTALHNVKSNGTVISSFTYTYL